MDQQVLLTARTLSAASCTDLPCLFLPFAFLPRMSNFLRLFSWLSNKFGLVTVEALRCLDRACTALGFTFFFAIVGKSEQAARLRSLQKALTICHAGEVSERRLLAPCGALRGKDPDSKSGPLFAFGDT